MSAVIRRYATIGAVFLLGLVAVACENTQPNAEERAAIEATVEGYLHALADAYSNLDPSALEDYASPQEIAAVHKLLKGLVGTGDRVDSTLRNYEIESIEIFRAVNANVTLIEVWDVVRVDAFTGREKGSNPGSVQNSVLQLRKMDGRWLVTARRIIGRGEPRWNVTTPTPPTGESQ